MWRVRVDYYPQPRPVLYGTSVAEAPPQTQTAPVRIGPPRYPPAPPLAGDAPDRFDPVPGGVTVTDESVAYDRGVRLLVLLFTLASVYSLLQIALGTTGSSDPVAGNALPVVEIVL